MTKQRHARRHIGIGTPRTFTPQPFVGAGLPQLVAVATRGCVTWDDVNVAMRHVTKLGLFSDYEVTRYMLGSLIPKERGD